MALRNAIALLVVPLICHAARTKSGDMLTSGFCSYPWSTIPGVGHDTQGNASQPKRTPCEIDDFYGVAKGEKCQAYCKGNENGPMEEWKCVGENRWELTSETSLTCPESALVMTGETQDFPDWVAPGKQVTYKGQVVTVVGTAMLPVVKFEMGGKLRTVDLQNVKPVSSQPSSSGGSSSGSSSSTAATMNIRQSIFCEVCLEGISSYSKYVPAAAMLDGTLPKPENNLGRLWECKPSERDYWRRDDRFKVSDTVASLPSECPSERRLPVITGKLSFARRVAKLAISKNPSTYSTCSKFVNDKAGTSQGRQIECTKDALYIFN